MGEQEDNHKSISWATAAQKSASVQQEAQTRVAEKPKRGDWVQHSKFGLCKVEQIFGEVMTIKLHDSQRKKLSLSVLEVQPPTMDGERRIFAVFSKNALNRGR